MKCENCWNKIEWMWKRFCCLSCSSLFNWKKIHDKLVEEYNLNPHICIYCWWKILHTWKNKNRLTNTKDKQFCSRSCVAQYWNKIHYPNWIPFKYRKCKWCWADNKRKNARYCSDKCLQEKQDKDTELKLVKNWTTKLDWIKHFLIRKRWHKCETCWITEWNWVPTPIEIHHLNWDSVDNREKNLKLICPNCHSQTDNYKSKNKNSTRKR